MRKLWQDSEIIELNGKKLLNEKASKRMYVVYKDKFNGQALKLYHLDWALKVVERFPVTQENLDNLVLEDFKNRNFSSIEEYLPHLLGVLAQKVVTIKEQIWYGNLLAKNFSLPFDEKEYASKMKKKNSEDEEPVENLPYLRIKKAFENVPFVEILPTMKKYIMDSEKPINNVEMAGILDYLHSANFLDNERLIEALGNWLNDIKEEDEQFYNDFILCFSKYYHSEFQKFSELLAKNSTPEEDEETLDEEAEKRVRFLVDDLFKQSFSCKNPEYRVIYIVSKYCMSAEYNDTFKKLLLQKIQNYYGCNAEEIKRYESLISANIDEVKELEAKWIKLDTDEIKSSCDLESNENLDSKEIFSLLMHFYYVSKVYDDAKKWNKLVDILIKQLISYIKTSDYQHASSILESFDQFYNLTEVDLLYLTSKKLKLSDDTSIHDYGVMTKLMAKGSDEESVISNLQRYIIHCVADNPEYFEDQVNDLQKLYNISLDDVLTDEFYDNLPISKEAFLARTKIKKENGIYTIKKKWKATSEEDCKKVKYGFVTGIGLISLLFMTLVKGMNPVTVIKDVGAAIYNIVRGNAYFSDLAPKIVGLVAYYTSVILSLNKGFKFINLQFDKSNDKADKSRNKKKKNNGDVSYDFDTFDEDVVDLSDMNLNEEEKEFFSNQFKRR